MIQSTLLHKNTHTHRAGYLSTRFCWSPQSAPWTVRKATSPVKRKPRLSRSLEGSSPGLVSVVQVTIVMGLSPQRPFWLTWDQFQMAKNKWLDKRGWPLSMLTNWNDPASSLCQKRRPYPFRPAGSGAFERGQGKENMILPTYPGTIPQTSPNTHKEGNSFINCLWNVWGIFQGHVGEILEKKGSSLSVWLENFFDWKDVSEIWRWNKTPVKGWNIYTVLGG